MKRFFLTALVLFMSGLSALTMAQLLTLKIIETHKDGEVSVSYDDGEYENDAIDKLDDDDLDMGWEGEDGNIMTTFLRFQNVTIPKGATINSAVLHLYAHEDEADPANITVYGEKIDNSPAFTETEELDDRTYTTASVSWDITETWTMWEPYSSPDLKPIIQEIVNRSGWASGNALTLFFQGEDQGASLLDNARDFESYENIEDPDDNGDGLHHPERIPTLVIAYGNYHLSAETPASQAAFSMYPNPCNSGEVMLTFDRAESREVSVFDIAGKNLRTVSASQSSLRLDLSGLSRGIYVVKVAGNSGSYSQKLILE